MFIKDLAPADHFVADFTHGTVYITDKVTTSGGLTMVEYHIPSQYADEGVKPTRGMFTKPSLSTITIAG